VHAQQELTQKSSLPGKERERGSRVQEFPGKPLTTLLCPFLEHRTNPRPGQLPDEPGDLQVDSD